MSVFIGYPSFMAYQMMKKGNNDGFLSIPGTIARYSALGLTNEQMAANPVWVDKTGNGHDLQMKNFAWKGMSGVGGYEMNFNLWTNNVPSVPDISMSTTTTSVSVSVGNSTYNNNLIYIHKNNWDTNKNHWLKITSTYEDGDLVFKFYNDKNSKNIELPANGYVNIPAYPEFKGNYMYISTTSNKQGSFTIEQLPLYPGALVFDGVDDYGVCDNFPILTKEKGYTVVALRQYLINTPTAYLTANGDSIENSSFIMEGNNLTDTWNFGKPTTIQISRILATQTSKQYDGVNLNIGTNTESSNLLLVSKWNVRYSKVVIRELVFLDHDATEEELTKIKDYFVKTYPWLFPDQAWTVTGKTNEDKDRATIANITGNGNDLRLSNFGFAEGSGYGLYKLNFNNWFANSGSGNVNIVNVVNPHKIVLEQSQEAVGAFFLGKNVSYSGELKISVSNKPSDIELSFGSSALGRVILNEGINIVKINPVNTSIGFFTNKAFEAQNIIIEQIPDYEGYLVTDGVDDKITSSTFEMGNDWTVIGDWELINTGKKDNAGIVKFNSIVIYNYNPILINIKNGRNNLIPDQNTVNAICSDGRIYSKDWKESIYNEETESTSKNPLTIGYSGNDYTKIAFRNLAIYPTVLSKEDCIKAYNYLQTLKAK